MRQRMSEKNVERLRRQLGMPEIISVLVRGGTDHRRDLLVAGGAVIYLWRDGTMTKSNFWKWSDPEATASGEVANA